MKNFLYIPFVLILGSVLLFPGCEDKSTDPSGPYGLIGTEWGGGATAGGSSDYYIDTIVGLSLNTNKSYDYVFKLFEISNTFKYMVIGTYTADDNMVYFTENALWKFDIYDDVFVEVESIPGGNLHVIDSAMYQEDSTLTLYRDGNAIAELSESTDS